MATEQRKEKQRAKRKLFRQWKAIDKALGLVEDPKEAWKQVPGTKRRKGPTATARGSRSMGIAGIHINGRIR